MQTALLLSALALIPTQNASTHHQGGTHHRGGATLAEIAGGAHVNFTSPLVQVQEVLDEGIYAMTMDATGTEWQESFLLGVPSNPLDSAPLLVSFHRYSASERDTFIHTNLFEEAMERGWYVLAPLGAHELNYGVPYAQENIRVVIDWISELARIDRERIYGIGFSMGGGCALNFAASNLDPNRAMFAAVVNHTGTVSIRDLWHRAVDTSVLEHPLMFNGSPYEQPFAYQQASTIELTPWSGVNEQTDLARNLGHVPVQTWCSPSDPLEHLVRQTRVLLRHLMNFGAEVSSNEERGNAHVWETLDEVQALDFLEAHRLELPTEGTHSLLATHDGRWLHFDIKQVQGGCFSSLRWHANQESNLLYLDGLANIERLRVRTTDLGLSTTETLRLILGTQAGRRAGSEGTTRLVLDGYDVAPRAVLREGRAAQYEWNPERGELSLEESDAANLPLWVIVP